MTTIEERVESLESEFRNRNRSAVTLLLLLVGGYLVAVSVAVVVYFIINPWHAEAYDPKNIWFILDILMVAAVLPALAFNTLRKLKGKASSCLLCHPRRVHPALSQLVLSPRPGAGRRGSSGLYQVGRCGHSVAAGSGGDRDCYVDRSG